MPRIRPSSGRHDLARVPGPAAGFPSLPSSPNNKGTTIVPISVPDAYDGRRRVQALARVDLLDRERRANRLDEASYLVGREVERVFESMGRIGGGGQWLEGDRIDAASTAEMAMVLGFERAIKVNAFLSWLVRHLGRKDTRLLWIVLAEGQSFAAAAVSFAQPGTRGQHYMADRFRDALGTLAEAKAAKGEGAAMTLDRIQDTTDSPWDGVYVA